MNYCFEFINEQLQNETRKKASMVRRKGNCPGFSCFTNAYILPCKDLWKDGKCYGGVVDRYMNYIMSSAWHEGAHRCDKYDFAPKQAKYEDGTVIYMGYHNSCWGHAITDNLKKLWFLDTEECKKLIKDGAKLVYITIDNAPMPSYICRLFQLAGVDIRNFEHITEIKCYDQVIVPDNSFIADNGERYYTDAYIKTIQRIIRYTVADSKKQYDDKIYFTRTGINGHRDTGEKNIERVFRKLGYSIISPEMHTVDEQIQMLQHCTHFAATEGSISHNAVFCRPNTEVTIIRKCNNVNLYQMAVNEVADVNVTYIDAHHSTLVPEKAPWAGPFFLYVNKNMKKWAGVKIIFPYFLTSDWLFYNLYNTRSWANVTRLFLSIKRRLKW